ncbi:MAG TPA: ATP-grasp domain-containing protein, partial [Polyangiaceae bacterium]
MSDLAILFGRPQRAPEADDRFELEVLAAEELGLESYAIPLDRVVDGEPERALRSLPRPRDRRWLYRGWMLNEEEYTALFEAVGDRGEELVVDPESFALATYAPNYLPLLGGHTAPARWTEGESIREAWEVAQELGPPPWVVKDHVKSAKEEWLRATFVPAGADYDDFEAVCERLLELRGDRFERGF